MSGNTNRSMLQAYNKTKDEEKKMLDRKNILKINEEKQNKWRKYKQKGNQNVSPEELFKMRVEQVDKEMQNKKQIIDEVLDQYNLNRKTVS